MRRIELADCRPTVQAFAVEMERKLRENDYKGGWDNMSLTELFSRATEELEEVSQYVAARVPSRHEFRGELADVANFLMMMADRYGNLGEVLPCDGSQA